MRKLAFVFAALSIVWELAGAAPCRAENNHSYVSSSGSGADCTLAAPCLFVSTAVNATYDGGEISCLDGGASSGISFAESLTIGKSITIDCARPLFNVTINGAGVIVTLRNLTVNRLGASYGANGIWCQNCAALYVENCVVDNWNYGTLSGIAISPPAGVTAKLFVTDSVIKNNGRAGAISAGIFIQPASGAEAVVTIERTKVENNYYGIYANSGSGGTIHGVVRDSVVSGNATWGIGTVNAGARLLVENTSVTANKFGLVAENGASMLVAHSSVVLNTRGLYAAGGRLSSYKNNNVSDNTADGAFTATIAQK